jgi:hypothetical protein
MCFNNAFITHSLFRLPGLLSAPPLFPRFSRKLIYLVTKIVMWRLLTAFWNVRALLTLRKKVEEYASTWKMEAARSFETSITTYQTTWPHIPENNNLHSCRCENLQSRILRSPVSSCRCEVCFDTERLMLTSEQTRRQVKWTTIQKTSLFTYASYLKTEDVTTCCLARTIAYLRERR